MGAGRGHPDLSAQLTLLLNSLDTFPPAVNRYNIVAKALEVQFAYKMPAWVTILLFVYIGLFGIVALLAIIGIGIRIYGRRARLLVMQEGLLILQAPIIFAAAMLCFSIAESIVIAEQAKAAREARPLTPAGAFGVGAGWIFAYLAITAWSWSTAASAFQQKSRLPSAMVAGQPVTERKRSWQIRTINTIAILSLVVGIPPIIVIFALAARTWSAGLDRYHLALAALLQAAPSYSPSTFTVKQDLVPLITPLFEVQGLITQLKKYYAVGFTFWAAYDGLFTISLLPFFVQHILQLLKLSRPAPTTFISLPAGTVDKATGAGSVRQPRNAAQAEQVRRFRTVLLASSAVLVINLTIFAIAVTAASEPDFLLNEDGGKMGAILTGTGVGVFAIGSPIALAIFARSSVSAYLAERRSAVRTDTKNMSMARPPNATSILVGSIRLEQTMVVEIEHDADWAPAPVPIPTLSGRTQTKSKECG